MKVSLNLRSALDNVHKAAVGEAVAVEEQEVVTRSNTPGLQGIIDGPLRDALGIEKPCGHNGIGTCWSLHEVSCYCDRLGLPLRRGLVPGEDLPIRWQGIGDWVSA